MVKLGSGWQPPEDYFNGEEGTYPATLVRIGVEDREGNFDEDATRTFESSMFKDEKTGEAKVQVVQDWRFAFEDGTFIEKAVAVPFVNRLGEEQVGERSLYYQYSCALLGKPSLKDIEWTKKDLIGREALVEVGYDDNGYPRVRRLGALPKAQTVTRGSQKVAAATGAPLRQQIEPTQPDGLPFP